jgi:hypothetical protein
MARAAKPSDEELDRVFGAPLEEFTAQRNELAKALRAGGQTKAADAIKGLRKPSRPAWLVNQLARREPDELEQLMDVGAELRELQQGMLAGGKADREGLRQAAASEQRLVDSLMAAARAIGAEHGTSAQALDKVGETLQACVSDPELAETVRRGRLERERRASSLGLSAPAGSQRPRKARDDAASAEQVRAEREQIRDRARRRKAAERRLNTAERSLDRARSALERAEEEAGKRREKVEAAEAEREKARAALDGVD